MAENRWTAEQQKAIDTRHCNLLVAAAAGSGKTAVLVERIIKIVLNEEKPVDIDKLLVVTFTKAAAAEMRERIGEAITRELDKNPASKVLQRQITLLNKANITTIHSFCLSVIKNNFHKVDLDPGFRISDDTEATLLQQETLQELLEKKYEEELDKALNESSFLKLVDSFGGKKDDSNLQQLILELYSFVMSGPWPEKWLKEAAKGYEVTADFATASKSVKNVEPSPKWFQVIQDYLTNELKGLRATFEKAYSIVKNGSGLEKYEPNFKSELEAIEKLMASTNCSWQELYESFNSIEFQRLKPVGKDADKIAADKAKALRDSVKDKLKAMSKELFSVTPEDHITAINEMHDVVEALTEVVVEFIDSYGQKKKEKSLLDFSDLEHLALDILTDIDDAGAAKASEIALNLQDSFEEIFVDEYQDSNKVQEVLVSMVSKTNREVPNVFMVGDVKQSIYRFRKAEPGIFLNKYENYSDREGERNRKITLYKNFRSRKEVLNAVNYVFKSIMSKYVGELEYTDLEALNLGASYPEKHNPVELHIIDKAAGNTTQGPEEAEDADSEEQYEEIEEGRFGTFEQEANSVQVEARLVGNRIKQLLYSDDGDGFKVFDKNTGGFRRVEPKDIVVLMRATTAWAPVFMEELKQMSLNVYADSDTGYFKTIEVQTMMSLLQVIDNPMQDIPLLAVLRSPIFSFTTEELIDIRMMDKGIPYYEALKQFVAEESLSDTTQPQTQNPTQQKVSQFFATLHRFREASIHKPIDELIWYLLQESGYYAYAGAMVNGAQRQANLKLLFVRARQFEATSYKGLFNFINFIDKLRKGSGDKDTAKILGENDNVVRIMSIHKSKGLEFPVVILAGTGKMFNASDTRKKMLLHQDLGIGSDYVNFERRITYPTIIKRALKKKIELEGLSEEMRVLYVALTRAKEKLIITGSINDLEKTCNKWTAVAQEAEEKLPQHLVAKGKCFLDWLGPVVARHKYGEELRAIAAAEETSLVEDSSSWQVYTWQPGDIIAEATEAIKAEDSASLDILEEKLGKSKEISQLVLDRLNWQYSFKEATKLPTKITVTELKRRINVLPEDEGEAVAYLESLAVTPAFMQGDHRLTAAERGTAMHSFMQHVDLKAKISFESFVDQVADLVRREILTPQQAKAIDLDKILAFFESSIGLRMLSATEVNREVPFFMRLSVTEIQGDLPNALYENESIMLQGIIDCYFRDGKDIVLLDYKTDFVLEQNINNLADRYKVQLQYYARALAQITGKEVKQCYLYLFHLDRELEVKIFE